MSNVAPHLDLRPDHLALVRDIMRDHVPDRKVLAFGSRATWIAKDYSDLDLAILGDEPLSLDEKSALAEDFVESDLPFKVDIVDWTKINETFREIIRRDGVVVQVPTSRTGAAISPERIHRHVARKQVYQSNKGRLSTGFSTVSLGEIAEITLSSVDKKTKQGEKKVLLCNYMDVYSRRFIRSDIPFMAATATEREIERCGLQSQDVVITKDSETHDDIGVPALICGYIENLVCGYHLTVLRPKLNRLSGPYLYYALQTEESRHQFQSYANGVTRFGLRKADIHRVEIPLPSLSEQRAIAKVLATFDEKIELNQRMNETLEELARTIFRDWFVDFGPTHAKMEGREPRLAPELWKLFPDALDEEGKPVGWVRGTLNDIVDFSRNSVNSSDVPDATPYIGLKHMPRRTIALSEWGEAKTVQSNANRFRKGSILFGKLRPYFHKVGIAPLGGICSTDIVVMAPRSQEWGAFALECLSSDDFVDYTDRTSTGTKMPRTSWKTMAKYEICLPSEGVVRVYQDIAKPLFDRLDANIHETSTLAQVRDLLLSKLMSGEICLRDAEKVMEALK